MRRAWVSLTVDPQGRLIACDQHGGLFRIDVSGDQPKVEKLSIEFVGAQGLLQVMPFHFTAGEDMRDPDTNARRGLNYFAERMVQTNGDVGRAFAGYNGGHGAAGSPYNTWANETQRYFYWATGILEDIEAGSGTSPRLQEWLNAGGASLCRQAAQRQGVDALLTN